MEARRRALTPYPLSTARLLLRELEPGDLDAVHGWSSDPEVCRHVPWGPNTREQTRAYLEGVLRERDDPDRSHWQAAVVLRATGEVVGSCAVWVTSAEHRRGELGYAFARQHWGRGYASEAARALVALAFGPLGLERVEGTCRPDNPGSQRVLEAAGLVLEGRLRGHVLVRGERRDSLLLAATAPTPAAPPATAAG